MGLIDNIKKTGRRIKNAGDKVVSIATKAKTIKDAAVTVKNEVTSINSTIHMIQQIMYYFAGAFVLAFVVLLLTGASITMVMLSIQGAVIFALIGTLFTPGILLHPKQALGQIPKGMFVLHMVTYAAFVFAGVTFFIWPTFFQERVATAAIFLFINEIIVSAVFFWVAERWSSLQGWQSKVRFTVLVTLVYGAIVLAISRRFLTMFVVMYHFLTLVMRSRKHLSKTLLQHGATLVVALLVALLLGQFTLSALAALWLITWFGYKVVNDCVHKLGNK